MPFGFSLPLGLAPFLSLTGDSYEMGSVLMTLGPWATELSRQLYRGDDVFRIIQSVSASGGSPVPVAVGLILGAVWSFCVYGLGAYIGQLLGQGPVPAGRHSPE